MSHLTLISFPLCPFVQRAIIALKEKGVDFDVVYIDLANKPDWFMTISPLGKVPVLKVEREGKDPAVIFESAVIIEYLEETSSGPKLHPADPLERAIHRGWIEVASQLLTDLWKLTAAQSSGELEGPRWAVTTKLLRLESVIAGPYFAGGQFSYVDAAFAPAFRQLDLLATIATLGIDETVLPKVAAWRRALANRPSVISAVPSDYAERFVESIRAKGSELLKSAA
jgi:glutathione S-transferase